MTRMCPRCSKPMLVVEARPKGAERARPIDRCASCGGLWLDADELMDVCPTVAGLHQHAVQIEALGGFGTGIMRCPRCRSVPYELRLLDLDIDVCLGCGGVWLDAHEQEGLVRGLGDDAHAPDKISSNPYRAIRQVRESDTTRCARCGERCSTRETFVAGEGLICRTCYVGAVAAGAGPEQGSGPPLATLRIVEGIEKLLRAIWD